MKEIYKITCKNNEKIYIGKTEISTQHRWKQHCYHAKMINHKDANTPLHRAIRKYGKNNFIVETIDTAKTLQQLNKKQQYWIQHYNSCNIGYNISLGGDGQLKYDYDEIVNFYLTHNFSLLDTCKNFNIYDQIVYSALQSKNIDYKNLPKNSNKTKYKKKIHCIELNKTFNSMSEIDKFFNKNVHGNIRRCLNGITKKAYGYHWKEI